MTKKQKEDLLSGLDIYKEALIINMTDKQLYNDPWKQSDINKMNKHFRLIKKIIKENN